MMKSDPADSAAGFLAEKIQEIVRIQALCDKLNLQAIQLPTVVVAGSQSHGKSSLLERIIGKDILPKGTKMVTRAKLRLQLITTGRGETSPVGNDEWVEFEKTDETTGERKVVTIESDLESNVRRAIDEETKRLIKRTGQQLIKDAEIRLRFYSPNVPPITLTDLPGLVQRLEWDDGEKDVERIKELTRETIANPNTIILAVFDATQDMEHCGILNIVSEKEVDPSFARTVLALTKVDLRHQQGHGTHALLLDADPKAPENVVGILNRGEKEKSDALDITMSKENEFFRKHYPAVRERHGVQYLIKMLTQWIERAIRERLPLIDIELRKMLAKAKEPRSALGEREDDRDLQKKLSEAVADFCYEIRLGLEGDTEPLQNAKSFGGAKISELMYDEFGEMLRNIKPLDGWTDEEIERERNRHRGAFRAAFSENTLVTRFLREPIAKMKAPSLEMLNSVEGCLGDLGSWATGNLDERFKKYPELIAKLEEHYSVFVTEKISVAKQSIEAYFKEQTSFPNVEHPYMRGEDIKERTVKVNDPGENRHPIDASKAVEGLQKEDKKTTRGCVEEYFKHILTSTLHAIPQAIRTYAVIQACRPELSKHMNKLVFDDKAGGTAEERLALFHEHPDVQERRDKLDSEIKQIEEGIKVIRIARRLPTSDTAGGGRSRRSRVPSQANKPSEWAKSNKSASTQAKAQEDGLGHTLSSDSDNDEWATSSTGNQ